jgi:hypothetical protein
MLMAMQVPEDETVMNKMNKADSRAQSQLKTVKHEAVKTPAELLHGIPLSIPQPSAVSYDLNVQIVSKARRIWTSAVPPPCISSIEISTRHQPEDPEGSVRTELVRCTIPIAICLAVAERPSTSAERSQGLLHPDMLRGRR